ncbi:MAG TPA: VWA domain-containing protein [Vicinamibacterales bacterium]|nr:VWA domain-containing protein [Vicinamibacterales bacterium]
MTQAFASRALIVAFVGLLATAPRAQPPARPDQAPPIAVTTTAVMVDVVVRDGRGRPVTDLTAEEFELFEDGVPQRIASFQLVSRGIGFSIVPAAPVSSTPPAPTVPDPTAGAGTLALVFDRLSPEARRIATRAALSHLEGSRLPGDRLGVFSIDLSLRTLQGYTADVGAVRAALQRVAAQAFGQAGGASGRARDMMNRQEQLSRQQQAAVQPPSVVGPANAAEASATGARMGGVGSDELFTTMELRMLQTFEALERDQAGYATTNALMAIVDSLRLLPGRKTIVLFSEGLAVTPAVQHHFRAVVDLANRANVAIYTVDAAGLRVRSELDEAREELQTLGRDRLSQMESGQPDVVGTPMMRSLERGEDLLRFDPHSTLNELARETGGLLIRNTNDLATGFRRIDEDMRFHYLLTYVPSNQEFDGKYRQISVKVKRPGVEVRARRGYYAIRDAGPTPVLPYEAPAFALLEGERLPNDFPVRAGALQFPEPNRLGLLPVLVAVRTDALGFRTDEQKRRYAAEFVILARLKNGEGAVVRKLSQQYELAGPLEQLPLARNGEVLFYKEPQVDPGVYTLETIVYDAVADRASARVATVDVRPAREEDLRASSLIIVRRTEEVPEKERDPANPLYYGNLLLYPNLGEPLRPGIDRELSFYVIVYPGRRDPAKLQARLELLQNGQPRGQAPLALGRPDAHGRIQHVGRLPLEGFASGSYELRLTVTDGRETCTRSASFIVASPRRGAP